MSSEKAMAGGSCIAMRGVWYWIIYTCPLNINDANMGDWAYFFIVFWKISGNYIEKGQKSLKKGLYWWLFEVFIRF